MDPCVSWEVGAGGAWGRSSFASGDGLGWPLVDALRSSGVEAGFSASYGYVYHFLGGGMFEFDLSVCCVVVASVRTVIAGAVEKDDDRPSTNAIIA